jgi:hypothetical protein
MRARGGMRESECAAQVKKQRRLRLMPGRVLWVGLALGVIGIAILWIWGIRNVGLLPDVGDPFDVAVALKPIVIPDSENAFVLYTQAKAKLPGYPRGFGDIDFARVTWSQARDDLRLFVDRIGQALEIWREGTDRPNALYHQPAEIAWDTPLPVIQDLGTLVQMAGLEGSRHEEKGEMAAAWTWYRAMLRSSRHVGMNGVLVQRMMGAYHHRLAARRILHWAADPRVGGQDLREALAEALVADALTPPISLALKLDYAVQQRDLVELKGILREISMPGGRFGWLEQVVIRTGAKPQIQRFRLHATNDVERSRRAIRLVYANWLPQTDRLPSARAPIALEKPLVLFAADPSAPPAARAVAPEDLAAAIDHTAIAREIYEPDRINSGRFSLSDVLWKNDGFFARETQRRAVLIVRLAAELYRREHGKMPVKAGELVGPYLKALPVGIDPDGLIPDLPTDKTN